MCSEVHVPDVPYDVPVCPSPQTLSHNQTHLGRAPPMQSSAELWELCMDEAIFLRRSRGGLERQNNKQKNKMHCEILGNFFKCNLAGV